MKRCFDPPAAVLPSPDPKTRIAWYMLPGPVDEDPVRAKEQRAKYAWLNVNLEAIYADRETFRGAARDEMAESFFYRD